MAQQPLARAAVAGVLVGALGALASLLPRRGDDRAAVRPGLAVPAARAAAAARRGRRHRHGPARGRQHQPAARSRATSSAAAGSRSDATPPDTPDAAPSAQRPLAALPARHLVEALEAAGARVIVLDVLFRPRTPGRKPPATSTSSRTSAWRARHAGERSKVLLAQDYKPTEPRRGRPVRRGSAAPAEPGRWPMRRSVSRPCPTPRPCFPGAPIAPIASGPSRPAAWGWTPSRCRCWRCKPTAWTPTTNCARCCASTHGIAAICCPRRSPRSTRTQQLQALVLNLRLRFREDPALAGRVLAALERTPAQAWPAPKKRVIRALVAAYSQDEAYFLNHYGPAGHAAAPRLRRRAGGGEERAGGARRQMSAGAPCSSATPSTAAPTATSTGRRRSPAQAGSTPAAWS